MAANVREKSSDIVESSLKWKNLRKNDFYKRNITYPATIPGTLQRIAIVKYVIRVVQNVLASAVHFDQYTGAMALQRCVVDMECQMALIS